ncbi:MAG: AmmeMemoRadiSam system protein B [Patescibacteria group bacterium]
MDKLNKIKNNSLPAASVVAQSIFPVNYNWPLFYDAIEKYPAGAEFVENGVLGLIAPHHDLAADYSAELFQKICRYNIKRVIIVGPNHENTGAGDIITGPIAYNLPDGRVNSNQGMVARIIKEGIAVSDISRLSTEHSISNITPYVNYCFPEAEIVPLILNNRITLEQAKALGEYLAADLNQETIIIASIDFSHYLPTERARVNDEITREALGARDYQKIYSFNDDYIDSPATAVTVLTATGQAGAENLEIVNNKNQAEAMGVSSLDSSTSYFTILLRR